MRIFLRNVATIIGTGGLIFGGACEQHHVGELPALQKEYVKGSRDEADGGHAASDAKDVDPAKESDMVKQAVPVYSPSAAPASASPTPANFFPKPSP